MVGPHFFLLYFGLELESPACFHSTTENTQQFQLLHANINGAHFLGTVAKCIRLYAKAPRLEGVSV